MLLEGYRGLARKLLRHYVLRPVISRNSFKQVFGNLYGIAVPKFNEVRCDADPSPQDSGRLLCRSNGLDGTDFGDRPGTLLEVASGLQPNRVTPCESRRSHSSSSQLIGSQGVPSAFVTPGTWA